MISWGKCSSLEGKYDTVKEFGIYELQAGWEILFDLKGKYSILEGKVRFWR